MIKLYDYFRSSASYRVRIALELKSVPYELIEVHLVEDGGKQYSQNYTEINPFQRVPALVDGDFILTQSLAIIAYLDTEYPNPSLLPSNNNQLRTQIISFAQTIACDIHPLNNLSVLDYLETHFNCQKDQKLKWYHHWIHNGFKAIEIQLEKYSLNYSFGNEITLADLCLIPQVYNAIRFQVDLTEYPYIMKVYENCNKLNAFIKASPDAVYQLQHSDKLTT